MMHHLLFAAAPAAAETVVLTAARLDVEKGVILAEPVLVVTDGRRTGAGVMPHKDAATQFCVMVQNGITPLQAIRAATIRAATIIADPLAGVATLERPVAIIKGGTPVKLN